MKNPIFKKIIQSNLTGFYKIGHNWDADLKRAGELQIER